MNVCNMYTMSVDLQDMDGTSLKRNRLLLLGVLKAPTVTLGSSGSQRSSLKLQLYIIIVDFYHVIPLYYTMIIDDHLLSSSEFGHHLHNG